MKPCPHCGREAGFIVKAKAQGPVEMHFGTDGVHDEDYYDELAFVPHSDAIRCDECARIRRDVRRDKLGNIVSVK